MRHKFPVLTVKKLLKSVYIYGSYRKNKIGVPFFWTTLYIIVTGEMYLSLFDIGPICIHRDTGYVQYIKDKMLNLISVAFCP